MFLRYLKNSLKFYFVLGFAGESLEGFNFDKSELESYDIVEELSKFREEINEDTYELEADSVALERNRAKFEKRIQEIRKGIESLEEGIKLQEDSIVLAQNRAKFEKKIQKIRKGIESLEEGIKYVVEELDRFREELSGIGDNDINPEQKIPDIEEPEEEISEWGINNELYKKIFGASYEDISKGEIDITIYLSEGLEKPKSFSLGDLPKEIGKLTYEGVEYTRIEGSLNGEFTNKDKGILKAEDGMIISIGKPMTEDEIKIKLIKIEKLLKEKERIKGIISEVIKSHGLSEPILLTIVKNELINDVNPENIDMSEEDIIKNINEKYSGDKLRSLVEDTIKKYSDEKGVLKIDYDAMEEEYFKIKRSEDEALEQLKPKQKLLDELDKNLISFAEEKIKLEERKRELEEKIKELDGKTDSSSIEKLKRLRLELGECNDQITKLNHDIELIEKRIIELKGEIDSKKAEFQEAYTRIRDKYMGNQIDFSQRNLPSNWTSIYESISAYLKISLTDSNLGNNEDEIDLEALNELPIRLLGLDSLINIDEKFGLYESGYSDFFLLVGEMIGGESSGNLGFLSAKYESGNQGSRAINPNNNGKPSFGTYQLRDLVLRDFCENELGFTDSELVGYNIPFSKGSNSPFAQRWLKKVAELGVEKFNELENTFIKRTQYDIQVTEIEKLPKIDNFDKFPVVIQNVVWSVAVQHGSGEKFIIDAVKESNMKLGDLDSMKKFVELLYEYRSKEYPSDIRRYNSEKQIILANLNILSINFPGSIISYPIEYGRRNPRTGKRTTLCSRTTWLNGKAFGLELPTGDANVVYEKNGSPINGFPPNNAPSSAKYADIFLYSSSSYGHRVFGFKNGNDWFILDPYYKIPGFNRREPIPADKYFGYHEDNGRTAGGTKYY